VLLLRSKPASIVKRILKAICIPRREDVKAFLIPPATVLGVSAVLLPRAQWHESERTEPDCEISDSDKPLSLVYGLPRACGWPKSPNDLLLYGRFDGGQWHWRRGKEHHWSFQHTLISHKEARDAPHLGEVFEYRQLSNNPELQSATNQREVSADGRRVQCSTRSTLRRTPRIVLLGV